MQQVNLMHSETRTVVVTMYNSLSSFCWLREHLIAKTPIVACVRYKNEEKVFRKSKKMDLLAE